MPLLGSRSLWDRGGDFSEDGWHEWPYEEQADFWKTGGYQQSDGAQRLPEEDDGQEHTEPEIEDDWYNYLDDTHVVRDSAIIWQDGPELEDQEPEDDWAWFEDRAQQLEPILAQGPPSEGTDDEEPEDETYWWADDYQRDTQPYYPVDDAWRDDEDPEDETYWWTDDYQQLVTVAAVPQPAEDAWDWEEEPRDEWDAWPDDYQLINVPPPVSAGNNILWSVGPKGIKTRVAFISGMDHEEESK